MDLINILIVSSTLVVAFLGATVFFRRKTRGDQGVSLTFSLISVAVIFWSGFIILYRLSTDPDQVFLYARLHHIASSFIPVFIFGFAVGYVRGVLNIPRWTTYIPYISAVTLSYLVFFTNKIIISVTTPEVGEHLVSFATGYLFYSAHFTVFFGGGLLLFLISFFRSQDKNYRRRTLILFTGILIASSVGMFTNLTLSYFGVFFLNWVGNVTTVVYVAFMFYAIVQFRLFNLKIIATEIFIFFIISFLVIQLFFAATFTQLATTAGLLLFIAVFSYLLIRSVYREVEQREEIEQLAERLEVANVKLKKADKMKTKLMSIASHDLRSPLGAIKGYASMMTEGSFGKLSEGGKEAASKIFEVAERMNGIVEDFLNVSRIEQGRLKYDFEIGDLVKLAKERATEQAPQAEEKGLELTFESSKSEFMVKMDIGKMEQIVNNLIDNAVKYTPKGSVHVSVKESGEDKVRLTVEDTGVGIPPEAKESLFKEFSRLEGGEKQNRGGTGLGLYIAKVMIEAHEGKIWAESEGENKGSRFIIELPLQQGEKA